MIKSFSGYQLTEEWTKLIEGLKSENPIESLRNIGDRIIFEDPQVALKLPFDDICSIIDGILANTDSILVIEAVIFCIRKLSETLENAQQLFSKTHILENMRDIMIKNISNSINENCLATFSAISKTRPEELGNAIGIRPLIEHIKTFTLVDQKNAFSTMARITDHYVSSSMAVFLTKIAKFFTHDDPTIVSCAIKTFRNIASIVDSPLISPKVITQVAVSLLVITDITSVLNLLTVLTVLMKHTRFVQNLIDSPIDFFTIMDQTQVEGREMDLNEKIIKLIYAVLKQCTPGLYDFVTWKPNNLDNFVFKVFPVIEEYILKQKGFSNLVLECLGMIVQNQPTLNISNLYNILATYSLDNNLAPIVVDILLKLSDLESLKNSSIIRSIIFAQERLQNESFQIKAHALLDKIGTNYDSYHSIQDIKSFDELYTLLFEEADNQVIDFVNKGGLEASLKFLQNVDDVSFNDIKTNEEKKIDDIMQKLVEACHEILVGFPIQHEEDPLHSERNSTFDHKSISVDLLYQGSTQRFRLEISIDFAAIENWFNQRILGVPFLTMKKAMTENYITHELLNINDRGMIIESKLAAINRACNTPNYKRLHFVINGKKFSWRDNVFQAIASTIKNPEDLTTMKPVIEIVEGDIERQNIEHPSLEEEKTKIPANLKTVLELLKHIKRLKPDTDVECKTFSSHLSQSLSSVVLTHCNYSVASSLFYHYPFVFTLSDRLLYFQESALDFASAVYAMHKRFVKPDAGRSKHQIKYNFTIKRENIYEDGIKIIRYFAGSIGLLEVAFAGDVGLGIGPTQEFFTLFSQEMCKTSRNMWRTEPGREFAFSEGGLYPLPTANKNDLYILGMFCAKALATKFIIDIPFHPSFIKTLRKDYVRVSDIDKNFANSIEDKSGLIGLDFTYPGIPSLELKPGGADIEVTEENINEYTSRIISLTCGDKMIELCQAFVSGFNEVIPFSSLSIFTPEEIITLLLGNTKNNITLEELRANVDIGPGYTSASPQIEYLFESITELSEEDSSLLIKFITGTNRLPIGGLSALQPKLTIALRLSDPGMNPDFCLPSVSTCFHYFKLPTYSSKEILKERLLTAIRECQGTFELT